MMTTLSTRREHYMRKVAEITDVVGLEDLTEDELVTLTVLLAPAHARFVAGEQSDVDQLGRWTP
ncbi:hypothetical protein A5653_02810 [Mycobacterium colombiense]|uniref:hypothetical protein n=1 Tax=Mycobacterium colombiense TaxID=339268 RepID=UPI0007EF5FAE|nr:hypothetical protein [Mycobacterium colombiense]OBK65856.1 hypothetical protein A5653_02810 [Mycobacterium colombiense]